VIFLNTYWNTQNQMYEFRFSFMGGGDSLFLSQNCTLLFIPDRAKQRVCVVVYGGWEMT